MMKKIVLIFGLSFLMVVMVGPSNGMEEVSQLLVKGFGIKIRLNQTNEEAREANKHKEAPIILKDVVQVKDDKQSPYGVLVDGGSHLEFVINSTSPFAYSVSTASEKIAEQILVVNQENQSGFFSHTLSRYEDEPRTIQVNSFQKLPPKNDYSNDLLKKMSCTIKIWPIIDFKEIESQESGDEGKRKYHGPIVAAAVGATVILVGGAAVATAFLVPAAAPILAPLGIVAVKKGLIGETIVLGAAVPWIFGSGATLVAGGVATATAEKVGEYRAMEGLIHKGVKSDALWDTVKVSDLKLGNEQAFNIAFYTRVSDQEKDKARKDF